MSENANSEPNIQCPACRRHVSTRDFLSGCSDFWADLGIVRFRCPLCRESTDARLRTSRIVLGYVYAAGAPHFCGMVDVDVPGLEVQSDGEGLAVLLGEARFRVAALLRRTNQ